MNTSRQAVALALSLLFLIGRSGFSQVPAPTAVTLPPAKLTILILEGANAVNSIPNRNATFPVVEVRDENNLPVEGADVVFELPATGPGGSFPNQKQSYSGRTNVQGQVSAPYIMNATPGPFPIKVTATIGNRSGQTTISQTHSMQTPEEMAVKKKRWYKDWRWWAVAGAGAATAIILTTTLGDDSGALNPGNSTIIISPGNPSIGAPR